MRRTVIRIGLAGIAGLIAVTGNAAFASHEELEFPVAIHAGTCEEPGDQVLALPNLVLLPDDAEGGPAGASGAQVVHGLPDDAGIVMTAEELFAADHILAVFDAAGETIIACGPIGAYRYDLGGDVLFGLRSQGDSPYSGVAIFDQVSEDDPEADEDEGGIDPQIYLVNNTPAPTATPAP